jgi:hypothetical protein
MRTIVDIPVQDTVPDIASVLSGQGIPASAAPDQRTVRMAEEALKRYAELAEPQGLVMDLGQEKFREVYQGRGQNSAGSPVAAIFPKADSLALFAATVGQALSREIERLFGANDFAAGTMLDAAASSGAELAAEALERAWRERQRLEGRLGQGGATMRFSPGYCGWHVSGQGRLFEVLKPSDIGLSLNESFLMQPLKSISGMIIAGERAIFTADRSGPACAACQEKGCLKRTAALAGQ